MKVIVNGMTFDSNVHAIMLVIDPVEKEQIANMQRGEQVKAFVRCGTPAHITREWYNRTLQENDKFINQ